MPPSRDTSPISQGSRYSIFSSEPADWGTRKTMGTVSRVSTEQGRKDMINKMASERVRKLLAEAAELPVEERATLVRDLARTLPEGYDAENPEIDYAELDRRMTSVRDGSATLVPWEEARKQLLAGG